jgi:UDP-4-amino-4,6-dideoxy-N-acetyl-beta-L-altrosamine transaminase
MIPYGRHEITKSDIDAIVAVLKSDLLTQGPMVPRFEKAVAGYCSAQHALAVNSATSALHIACLALDLGLGDWLWTTPTSFVASANCGLYCNASVDFVDIDPRTYNICPQALEQKLIEAEKLGCLPKIVIPVHLCGQPCDMLAIYSLAQRFGFKIIEDASHAIGGKYKGEPIGNCRYSDITVFSFHPVKIITTGEGGMALTNNSILADRMLRYRGHGITNDASKMQPRPLDEIWNYQQINLGFNYRMTDIQAVLGVSQMTRLHEIIEKRHGIAKRYDDALAEFPLQTQWQHPDSYSSYHLYSIRLKLGEDEQSQRQVYDALHAAGILVNLHYMPIYRQPYYEVMGFKEGYCPEAELYHKEALSIPMYPTLTESDQSKVIFSLHDVLG